MANSNHMGSLYGKKPVIMKKKKTTTKLAVFFESVKLVSRIIVKWIGWRINLLEWIRFIDRLRQKEVEDLISGVRQISHTFPWKLYHFCVVQLGTFKSWRELKGAIEDSGMEITDEANDIACRPALILAQEETKVQLVEMSVGSLGFPDGSNYSDICESAKKLGLYLCPPEVGPQLRLQYKDQRPFNRVTIATNRITGSDGCDRLFRLDCSFPKSQELDAVKADGFWGRDETFLFVLPE